MAGLAGSVGFVDLLGSAAGGSVVVVVGSGVAVAVWSWLWVGLGVALCVRVGVGCRVAGARVGVFAVDGVSDADVLFDVPEVPGADDADEGAVDEDGDRPGDWSAASPEAAPLVERPEEASPEAPCPAVSDRADSCPHGDEVAPGDDAEG